MVPDTGTHGMTCWIHTRERHGFLYTPIPTHVPYTLPDPCTHPLHLPSAPPGPPAWHPPSPRVLRLGYFLEVADSSLGLVLDPLSELFEGFPAFGTHPSFLSPFDPEIGTCKAYLPCNSLVFAYVSCALDQDISSFFLFFQS